MTRWRLPRIVFIEHQASTRCVRYVFAGSHERARDHGKKCIERKIGIVDSNRQVIALVSCPVAASPRIERNNMCQLFLTRQQTQMKTTLHQHAETNIHCILRSIVTGPSCITTILSGQFPPPSLLGLSSHLIARDYASTPIGINLRTFIDNNAFDVTGNRCGNCGFHLKT